MHYILSLLFILSLVEIQAQPERKSDGGRTSTYLEYLSADARMGRRTGEPGNDEAAAYIAKVFSQAGLSYAPGLTSFFQEIPFVAVRPSETYQFSLQGVTFQPGADCLILSGKGSLQQAPVVFARHGLEDAEAGTSDYDGLDVSGKVVIVLPGAPGNTNPRAILEVSRRKRDLALKKGAAALLELYQLSTPWPFFTRYFGGESLQIDDGSFSHQNNLIYGWVKDKNDLIRKGLIADKTTMSASLSSAGSTVTPKPSRNVIGIVEGSHPTLKKEYVLLSAHFDHVGAGSRGGQVSASDSIFNGARDNAFGTTALLHAAANLAKKRPARSIIFLAVTGEEIGLLGSKYYAGNPLVPLHHTVFNLNTDGAGYNSTRHVSVLGWGRTGTDNLIALAARRCKLEIYKDPAPEQNLFDRSDNVSFAEKGVPALTFSPGFDAFDDQIARYYHTVADEAASVDKAYLLRFSQTFAHLARLIADAPFTPTWAKGDKYEDAARKLYRGNGR